MGTKRAYIGSFTSAGGHGITVAAVDPGTGALAAPRHTDVVDDPSFLVPSPDGRLLYAVSERPEDGAAAVFSLEDPDTPVPLRAPVPVNGGSPTHLCLYDGHLLTANYGSGDVSVLPVAEDGALGPVRGVLRHDGAAPHAHMVLPDPTGRWLLTVDLGTDSVRVCGLDPATGVLEVHDELRLRTGIGPRHMVFHPAGDHAYVMNELESVVTVCRWDAEAGRLLEIAETSVLPEGAAPGNAPSELVLSPDGRFAWAANRGHNSIAVLAVDADGRLRLTETVGCGGDWPRHLTLGPGGDRLYVANERSGDVTWFDVDPGTGTPRRAGSMPAPAASCVVFA